MNRKGLFIAILAVVLFALAVPLVHGAQDFTTYTEVDTASEMTVNSTHIYVNGIFSDGATQIKRVYISNPTNHDSFDVEFNIYVTEMSSTAERGGIAVFTSGSTTVQDINTLDNYADFSSVVIRGYDASSFQIYARNVDSTGTYSTLEIYLNYDTWYHIRFNHTSASATYRIYAYTGKDKTSLYASQSITGGANPDYGGTDYEFYAIDSWGGTVTGTHSEFYISDMTISDPAHLADSGSGTNYNQDLIEYISQTVTVSTDKESLVNYISQSVSISVDKQELPEYLFQGVELLKNGDLVYSSFWGIGSFINMTLNDSGDGWLFKNEVYEITAYVANMSSMRLFFNDGSHIVNLWADNRTGVVWGTVSGGGTYEQEGVLSVLGGQVTRIDAVTDKVTWRFMLERNIIDRQNVKIYYQIIDSEGGEKQAWTGTSVNLYNLGGSVEYNFIGTAGRVTGGDWNELKTVNDNDRANASIVFRRLQHVKALFKLNLNNTWDDGTGLYNFYPFEDRLKLGIDYMIDGVWVDGWEVEIFVNDASSGHANAGGDRSWIELVCIWTNQGVTVDYDYIVIYHNGYNIDINQDVTNDRSLELWLDFWFNRANSSSVVGGRVNGYYNGIAEVATPFWGYGSFVTKTGNETASQIFTNLLDASGQVTDCYNVELVRFNVDILRNGASEDGQEHSIKDWLRLDFTTAQDRMQGIDTPTFDEPQDPDIPKQGGLFGGLAERIGQFIWSGLLGAVKTLVNALDTIATWFGMPAGFINSIINMVVSLPVYFLSLVTLLGETMVNLLRFIETAFNSLTFGMLYFIELLGRIVSRQLQFWKIFIQLMTGGYGQEINIWQDYGLETFITIGLVFLPWWELNRVLGSKQSIDTLRKDVGLISGIFNFFVEFLKTIIWVIQVIVDMIMGVVSL